MRLCGRIACLVQDVRADYARRLDSLLSAPIDCFLQYRNDEELRQEHDQRDRRHPCRWPWASNDSNWRRAPGVAKNFCCLSPCESELTAPQHSKGFCAPWLSTRTTPRRNKVTAAPYESSAYCQAPVSVLKGISRYDGAICMFTEIRSRSLSVGLSSSTWSMPVSTMSSRSMKAVFGTATFNKQSSTAQSLPN